MRDNLLIPLLAVSIIGTTLGYLVGKVDTKKEVAHFCEHYQKYEVQDKIWIKCEKEPPK